MKNGNYELIIAPDDWPGKKYREKYCLEHHYVYWKNTGILCEKGFIIHHKNCDRFDNRFENLELLSNRQHSINHALERKGCEIFDKNFPDILDVNSPDRHPFPEYSFSKKCIRFKNMKFIRDKKTGEKKYLCPKCKKNYMHRSSKVCIFCYERPKTIIWPLPEEMKKLIWKFPITKLKKILGTSCKAIVKYCKKYNIEKPPIGYWNK